MTTPQQDRTAEIRNLAAKLRTMYLNESDNKFIYRAADELDALELEASRLTQELNAAVKPDFSGSL